MVLSTASAMGLFKHQRPWTPDQDAVVLTMDAKVAAEKLGRTIGGCPHARLRGRSEHAVQGWGWRPPDGAGAWIDRATGQARSGRSLEQIAPQGD
jgi:hypothetical protein